MTVRWVLTGDDTVGSHWAAVLVLSCGVSYFWSGLTLYFSVLDDTGRFLFVTKLLVELKLIIS